MKPKPDDAGTISALMIRLKEFRLPRAQRIERKPEYLSLVSRMIDLYSDIVSRSL